MKQQIMINAIKDNMEYFNYSNDDLSQIANISQKTIRNILAGKTIPDLNTLTKLEEAFEMQTGDLVMLQVNIDKKYNKENLNETLAKAMDFYIGEYSTNTIIEKVSRIFKGKTPNEYKELMSNTIVGRYQYKDNELANLWIALAMKAIEGKEFENPFYKTRENVFDRVLTLMAPDIKFEEKMKAIGEYLASKGVYIINKPFLQGSSIRGVAIKRNKRAFILMNDNGKRECLYMFTLMHELAHLFTNLEEKEINKFIAKKIAKQEKSTISIKELIYTLETFGNDEQFTLIHDNTTRKVNFGKATDFVREYI